MRPVKLCFPEERVWAMRVLCCLNFDSLIGQRRRTSPASVFANDDESWLHHDYKSVWEDWRRSHRPAPVARSLAAVRELHGSS